MSEDYKNSYINQGLDIVLEGVLNQPLVPLSLVIMVATHTFSQAPTTCAINKVAGYDALFNQSVCFEIIILPSTLGSSLISHSGDQ